MDFIMKYIHELQVFFCSMLPIVELRGGIPLALAYKIDFLPAFLLSVIGNMIPIPFAFLFIRYIFDFMKRFKLFNKLVTRIEDRVARKANEMKKVTMWSLMIFVAIPLPGTGAWTGAFIAAFLKMRLKDAFLPIALGVVIAGVVVTGIAYGALGFLKFLL